MQPQNDEVPIPAFPNIDFAPSRFPTHDQRPLPKEALYIMYAGYVWFKYQERYLLREEVVGVINTVFYKGRYTLQHTTFNIFENPDHRITKALKRLEKDRREALGGRFVRWFKEFLENDDAAALRARFFSSFLGRVNFPQVNTPTVLDNKILEVYQLSTHYAILHWCKNGKGEKLSPIHIQQILEQFYEYENPTKLQSAAVSQLTKKLQNPNHTVTVDVAKMNAGYNEYKKWIMRKANVEVAKWERNQQMQAQIGQVFDLSSVTRALEGSALQTASAPNQLPRPEPRLSFPDNITEGPRRRELIEQARRKEKNESEEGQRGERRRKRSQSPEQRQHHRPKSPPPPPPPAAGSSRTPRSLPYDPARA